VAERRALTVLGVDGCPGGWIGALVTASRRGRPQGVRWVLLPDAAAIVAAAADVAVTAVDMPIGLPDVGPRACDVAARALLGPRASSVFPAPVRPVLDAVDYVDACERSRATCGRALSKQAWAIVPRIADLDAVLTPALQETIVEAHPELAFVRLSGGWLQSKRTAAGAAARTAALEHWLPGAAEALAAAPRPARRDDAADALVLTWVALRRVADIATVLPAVPERDARGLRMEIVS
jgi:predicted RNase H-like nuclease